MSIDSIHLSEPKARGLTPLLAALTALTSLSIDMSLPAMPQLQQTFRANVSSVQLTLSVFLMGFALGQIVCGPVSDRRGRRPVLLAGLGLFAHAGIACASSVSLAMLARYVNADVTRVPQVFIPYKEVLTDYRRGLKVPEDVTIVYTDDNFGYIRSFPHACAPRTINSCSIPYAAPRSPTGVSSPPRRRTSTPRRGALARLVG